MLPADARVLVVEDSAVAATQIIQTLNGLHYRNIVEARNGLEAIQKLAEARANNSKYDLVVTDWEMPLLTGLEFFQMVKAIPYWKETPFVFLTSFNSMDAVVSAAAAGVEHYLIKPITPEALGKKIRSISDQSLADSVAQLMHEPPKAPAKK